jgi:prepilin-type N-terminal cleavage/methylation domain-containing protein
MQSLISRVRTRKGFTLVELAVVIVIIGVLAAFGVPKFLQSVEKSKAAEAFNYLSTLAAAQERYIAQNGVYYSGTNVIATGSTTGIDVSLPTLQYFTGDSGGASAQTPSSTASATSGAPTWGCTLTRLSTSSSYGTYTVAWNQDGFDASNSSIPQAISPVTGDVGTGS